MFVKFAPGSRIDEQDLGPALFAGLLPAPPFADRLIINGIGEPLLHPRLEELISLTGRHLPPHGSVGLQSNGVLIDRGRAEALLDAGLDTAEFANDCCGSTVPCGHCQWSLGGIRCLS